MALSDDLSTLAWLTPWAPLTEASAQACQTRLVRATSPGHPLHGVAARAVAARHDEPDEQSPTDIQDVLFLLSDPERLCVVNLPAGQKRAADETDIPVFSAFESVEAFHDAYMMPDHLEYSDDDV